MDESPKPVQHVNNEQYRLDSLVAAQANAWRARNECAAKQLAEKKRKPSRSACGQFCKASRAGYVVRESKRAETIRVIREVLRGDKELSSLFDRASEVVQVANELQVLKAKIKWNRHCDAGKA